MLNYLWAGMILVGIVFGAFNGRMQDITNAALDSSKEAVTLCITMIGVMAFWTGIMEIASKAGIIRMASRKMRPLVRFLFPGMPEGHKAEEHITTNFRLRQGSGRWKSWAGWRMTEGQAGRRARRGKREWQAMRCVPSLSSISPRSSLFP